MCLFQSIRPWLMIGPLRWVCELRAALQWLPTETETFPPPSFFTTGLIKQLNTYTHTLARPIRRGYRRGSEEVCPNTADSCQTWYGEGSQNTNHNAQLFWGPFCTSTSTPRLQHTVGSEVHIESRTLMALRTLFVFPSRCQHIRVI